eukprot:2254436-Pyramimonas_sp.AAC.1
MADRSRTPGGPRHWQHTSQSERDAGSQLLTHLLRLYASCRLSAKDFCSLCYFAREARVPGGAFHTYAVSPSQKSEGNYQKHLDTVLPCLDDDFVDVIAPVTDRQYVREQRTFPMRLAWSSLETELANNPSISRRLQSREASDDVLSVPAYQEHPSVVEALANDSPLPLPLAFYLDAVQYQAQAAGRSDNVLGFWIINLLTGRRHFMSAIKGLDFCNCGCRGNCSLYPFFSNL